MTKYIFLLFVLIIIYPSCAVRNAPQSENVIHSNLKLWTSHKIDHYQVTQQMRCFCNPTMIVPRLIEVNDGYIVSIDGTEQGGMNKMYKSIPDFFNWIESQMARNPAIATYSFDKDYGFPNEIFFDMDSSMFDEEIRYTLTDFKILN
ncbi:MAG: hypothetical protein HQ474_10450 [Flammeovirgaceae bacterium]|jgi:hypothetical protein|nr:hypothetical protein [Flammeovirgaceae bacterium]|tara:strand:+ start:11828 stop:12268 length:441 start_codon:yes stop_codon:yes gene_type:complete